MCIITFLYVFGVCKSQPSHAPDRVRLKLVSQVDSYERRGCCYFQILYRCSYFAYSVFVLRLGICLYTVVVLSDYRKNFEILFSHTY